MNLIREIRQKQSEVKIPEQCIENEACQGAGPSGAAWLGGG